MSSPSPTRCVYCQTALTRPDARFCTACGKPQPASVGSPPNLAGPTLGLGAALVVLEDGQARSVPLAATPITLGRAPDNTITLASLFVSGHHARIEPLGSGHRITDVGSTNGVLFEGRRVMQHDLCDGDVLRIGDPATGSFVTLTYRNGAALRTPQASRVAQNYPLNPNDPQVTLGRAGCDIVLDNPQVSRFHAQLDRSVQGVTLRDVGSTNGTFVNGQRITNSHTLRAGDVIQIGSFKLIYNVTSLDQYDQQGALRIDARGLTRRVSRGGEDRIILDDVSLSIAPREFVALVGGSGTGKSTLMKALCGYAPATTGQVLVNGDDFYHNFDAYRTVLGYVPQDDILHRTLPVKRALGYAARLRLPADTADTEIDARITRVLEDVDMLSHRDKLVENLSGGQRKRVSIGAELLADPSLFFLDEPTSGLDPGLEKKMMYTLRRLADSGRTVILVTHATANITQCDHVVFMAAGRMVYFGPPTEALSFFNVTSGDFADIYTKIEGQGDVQNPIVQRDLQVEYRAWVAANPNAQVPPSLSELWQRKYRASDAYQRYVTDRLAQTPPPAAVQSTQAPQHKHKVSPIRQFGILAQRYMDLTLQDRRNLFILLLQAPIIAFLLLLVARSDALLGAQAIDLLQRGEAKKVLFMLATVSVWFGIINAAREITKELPIFQRERLVNLRIGPYLLSKIAVLSALILGQTIVLIGIVALKVEFPADTGVFMAPIVETFITLLLTALTGMALGLVISAASDSGDRAISIVPMALIPQILFAGLIFKIEGIATPLSWLTISRWSMDALGMSMDLNTLCNLPNTDSSGSIPPGCSPGFLDVESSFSHSPTALLGRWAAMLIYTLICVGITAWLLRRRDRQI